jgi:membrane associated rhomboid family serine protease
LDFLINLLYLIQPLPILTDKPIKKVPYITYTLIFINILIFMNMQSLSQINFDDITHRYGFVMATPSVTTVFTSMFLHGSISHLGGNMLMLWVIGTILEAGIGSLMFSLLYFATGISAVMLHSLITKISSGDINISLIGASGAISGIAGFAMVRYFRTKLLTIPLITIFPLFWWRFWFPMWAYCAFFGAREIFIGIISTIQNGNDSVAHWAHVGGFLLGLLAAYLIEGKQDARKEFALDDTEKVSSGSGDKWQTLEDINSLIREMPDDPDLREARAGLNMIQGNLDLAMEDYIFSLPRFLKKDDYNKAALVYENIMRINPEYILPVRETMIMATIMDKNNHIDAAINGYINLLKSHPQSDVADNALLRLAAAYYKNNDVVNSKKALLKLIEQYPGSQYTTIAKIKLDQLNKLEKK